MDAVAAARRRKFMIGALLALTAVVALVLYLKYRGTGQFSPVDGSCPANGSMNPLTQECECNPGYYATRDTSGNYACVPCPPGQYSSRGATECTFCPAGTTTMAAGATSSGACVNANVNSAATCTPGFFFNESQQSCAACPVNSYSDGNGQTSCAPCPAGTYTTSDGASSVSQCMQFSGNNSGCPPGYSYDAATRTCVVCPAGTYSLGGYAASCTKCPAGSTTMAPGANTVALCQSTTGGQSCSQAIQQVMNAGTCAERAQLTMPASCASPAEQVAWKRAQCFGNAASGCQSACGANPNCFSFCSTSTADGGMATCTGLSCLTAMLQNVPCEQRCAIVQTPQFKQALLDAGYNNISGNGSLFQLVNNPLGCIC
jgi:hypothetical protein